MRRILIAAFATLALTPAASGGPAVDPDSFVISADQWSAPRSGLALVKLAPIHAALVDWLADPQARLVIQHAGSDTGNLWAGELQDWLVALGVPADRIDKRVSADQSDDAITLKVQHG